MDIPAQLKARTNGVLSLVAGQIQTARDDQRLYSKCVNESAQMLSQLATTVQARMVLARLSTLATNLEGAYIRNAANLRADAAQSDKLWWINGGLSVCYIAVAAGKVADMYASATGVGKVVTTAKSSFLDMTDAMRNKDVAMAGAHAANLTMIGVGKEVLDITSDFDTLQSSLHAILNLIKDFRVMWSGNDLGKVLPQFRQALPRFLDLIAKFLDTLTRATSLYANYQKVALPKVLGSEASGNTKIVADSFAAIKYGIEAVANLCQALNSGIDWWENWDASAQDNALADQQLSSTGSAKFELDLSQVAAMSDRDLTDVIHSVSSASDADRLAADTGMKAKQLDADADSLRHTQTIVASRLGPLNAKLQDSLTRIQSTDTELRTLRKQFQALEPGRDVYSLQVAVWLSDIDSKRAQIIDAVGR